MFVLDIYIFFLVFNVNEICFYSFVDNISIGLSFVFFIGRVVGVIEKILFRFIDICER